MEYCEGGDLYKFMVKSEVLHPLFVRKIIQQICLGLAELKTKELIHRDLKTENIFLTRNFQAKIGDLGFCVTTTEENVIHNVGSPIYMSPEVLNGGAHSFESDIYGLGVIWYELLHKTAPWLAKTEAELL
jgi:serine/threonine protein kinase